MLLDSCIRK